MEQLIREFPQNIVDAIEIAKASKLSTPKSGIQNIVICGMGGSGIGGKIVAEWLQPYSPVPVLILNDYTLPAFVSEHSLVIGSSYSGNTEETLEALGTAHKKNATILAICSGGRLKDFCIEHKYDFIEVPGGNPPRSAIAFSIVQLTHIFHYYGFIPSELFTSLSAAVKLIQKEEASIHAIGKEIASFMFGKVGVIYALAGYEGVAVRARQQFNENSKYLCWHHIIPEMNHNELVGWGGGDARFAVLALITNDSHPRNLRRYQINKEVFGLKASGVFEVEAIGQNAVERSIYLINLVDWASFYLCELNKADIMDIKVIDNLKDELANFK